VVARISEPIGRLGVLDNMRADRAATATGGVDSQPSGHPSSGAGLEFSDFHRTHRDRLAAALAVTCGNLALGQDAADEALARALAHWPEVRHTSNPAGWTYRVGLNWTRNLLRRRRREDLLARLPELADTDPTVDIDVGEALDRLDIEHRTVVVMRHLIGCSTAETAEYLGVAEGTVKSRLARALDRLRADLGDSHGS